MSGSKAGRRNWTTFVNGTKSSKEVLGASMLFWGRVALVGRYLEDPFPLVGTPCQVPWVVFLGGIPESPWLTFLPMAAS